MTQLFASRKGVKTCEGIFVLEMPHFTRLKIREKGKAKPGLEIGLLNVSKVGLSSAKSSFETCPSDCDF